MAAGSSSPMATTTASCGSDSHGHIAEDRAFGNVVPTGLETIGPVVLTAQAGPLPHNP